MRRRTSRSPPRSGSGGWNGAARTCSTLAWATARPAPSAPGGGSGTRPRSAARSARPTGCRRANTRRSTWGRARSKAGPSRAAGARLCRYRWPHRAWFPARLPWCSRARSALPQDAVDGRERVGGLADQDDLRPGGAAVDDVEHAVEPHGGLGGRPDPGVLPVDEAAEGDPVVAALVQLAREPGVTVGVVGQRESPGTDALSAQLFLDRRRHLRLAAKAQHPPAAGRAGGLGYSHAASS